jgi:succinyl-diaminopimelate desuccinylase
VRGVQGHVAYPHKAKNPLPGLLDALDRLRATALDTGNQHFQASNFEITSIDTGNKTSNLIPASVMARFNIRFNDQHTSQSLKEWIEEQTAAALLDTGLTHAIEYESGAESFLTQPGAFVQKFRAAIEAETGREPVLSTGGGTSDARFIKDLCPVVECGLLNETAHKVDENTPVRDLQMLARIYTRFLRLTLGGGQ